MRGFQAGWVAAGFGGGLVAEKKLGETGGKGGQGCGVKGRETVSGGGGGVDGSPQARGVPDVQRREVVTDVFQRVGCTV